MLLYKRRIYDKSQLIQKKQNVMILIRFHFLGTANVYTNDITHERLISESLISVQDQWRTLGGGGGGGGNEIFNMYAFGVHLRYANLSNITLGISNSLFNYCNVTITLYSLFHLLLNNAKCDIWYHYFCRSKLLRGLAPPLAPPSIRHCSSCSYAFVSVFLTLRVSTNNERVITCTSSRS